MLFEDVRTVVRNSVNNCQTFSAEMARKGVPVYLLLCMERSQFMEAHAPGGSERLRSCVISMFMTIS
jgi:hypothetical protein